MRELGKQLGQIRMARGWTHKQLRARLKDLGLEVSVQTVATWQLGTRAISAVNLHLVCVALDFPADEVMRRTREVLQPSVIDDPHLTVTIDLVRLAHTTAPLLAPAQRWAAALHAEHGRDQLVTLSPHALRPLAALCDVTPSTLLDAIRNAARP